MKEQISRCARGAISTREALAQSRLVGRLAERSQSRRYTRRSVRRVVVLGRLARLFVMVPRLQVIGAALLCVPFLATIPLAAGATALSNPGTNPPILVAVLVVGSVFGFDPDFVTCHVLIASGAGFGEWLHWLLAPAASALVLGLAAIAVGLAVAGYDVSVVIRRSWTACRRRTRLGCSPKPEPSA
jgi:hypothetical protein